MASNVSPITLGLLALLAYRTYEGKGRLADMLGRGQTAGAPGASSGSPTPASPAPGGGLGDILGSILGGGAGASPAGAGPQGGGLGDILGSILGGGAGASPAGAGTQPGGLGGLLGGLLAGGAAGNILSGGLGSLLEQFQQNGQGEKADSWIGKGDNQPLTSDELEHAVGKDALEELARHSGKSYASVVSELSAQLPKAVDDLTPEGRIPTSHEAGRWV